MYKRPYTGSSNFKNHVTKSVKFTLLTKLFKNSLALKIVVISRHSNYIVYSQEHSLVEIFKITKHI